MGYVVMRNRVSTEYKKVEEQSPEYWALRAELGTDGKPRWEQTGEHDLAAFEDRLNTGNLRATDVGDAANPAVIDSIGDTDTSPQLDRGWPTPGELEQGAGRAADFDEDELKTLRAAAGVSDPGTGYPAGHAPEIPEVQTEEERISEGVADDPLPDGGQGSGSDTSSSGGTNWGRQGVDALKAEADRRELEVTRADGNEGDPLKSDYVSALEADDAKE